MQSNPIIINIPDISIGYRSIFEMFCFYKSVLYYIIKLIYKLFTKSKVPIYFDNTILSMKLDTINIFNELQKIGKKINVI